MQKTLKILAVDDTAENLNLLEHFIHRQHHSILKATTGQEAIDLFRAEKPDLILMDVMMPDMDGYEATRQIRELAGDQWIPIIFMSAMTATEDQIEGLDAGGDDYLTKPVSLKILAAKIKAMQRIAEMREALARQAAELELYRKAAEEEKYFAHRLMDHMTRVDSFTDERMESWSQSAEHLNGDLVAACRTRDGKLFFMVSDATGHGLLAAIMQLPVSQTFYEMADEGASLGEIVRTMNSRLRQILPRDRFVAAILVMIDDQNRQIEVWNGGAPDAFVINDQHEIIKRFTSSNLPLGISPDEVFDARLEIFHWQENCDLVIYSDGVIDALDPQGQAFGEARLKQAIQGEDSHHPCQQLSHALQAYLQGHDPQDDISVLCVHCQASDTST